MNEVIEFHSASIICVKDGHFLSVSEMFIDDIDKALANTILARYYKGLEADCSNCVIVKFLGEDK